MNRSIWQCWKFHTIGTILSVHFYIFTEWLFFVTKPSFMSALSFKDTFFILMVSPLPMVLAGGTALFVCWVFSRFRANMTYQRAWVALSRFIPTFILSVSLFLLIDNFTYTVFRFGVISTKGLWGLCYLLLFLIIFSFVYGWLFRMGKRTTFSPLTRIKILCVISLPVISFIGFLATHIWAVANDGHQEAVPGHQLIQSAGSDNLGHGNKKGNSGSLTKRPDIIFIATDGLNAERMSVYGYKRNTTPNIEAFTKGTSLFCENAFTNAASSGASIASMMTGKLPTDTKLYGPPDILRGKDAFQHLPAILRQYGYRNIDFSMRYYADPYDLNMRNSFDESNFRKIDTQEWTMLATSELDYNVLYFLNLLKDRVQSRFIRMLCQRETPNPFDEVTGKKVIYFYREPILKRLLNFIDESPSPFFAHVHLMVTHGPTFHIRNRVFSEGQEQRVDWMDDFFDDAVLEYDLFISEILQALKYRGKLKNTVVVINTDHGMDGATNVRLPLIIIFPDGAHAGRITSNAQNLDIAATLLDYLAIPRPHWMKGHSLISGEPPRLRPVFSSDTTEPKENERGLLTVDKAFYKPPFYNLGKVSMIICDKSYELNLNPVKFSIHTIMGHTDPCGETEILEKQVAVRRITDHLSASGY